MFSPLSNVPIGTANLLAYTMVVVVAVFLVFGPLVTYYYWKKLKRSNEPPAPSSA